MRIVITKNGKIIIQEINPDIKYKRLLARSTIKNHMQNNPTNKSLNKNTSNSFDNKLARSSYNNNATFNKEDIDDVLINMKNQNTEPSNFKVVKLSNTKKLNMPSLMAEKYMKEGNSNNNKVNNSFDENKKNLLPDVFVSINKNIEREANEKGYEYIYDTINCLKKDSIDNYNSKSSRGNSLPQSMNLNETATVNNSRFTLPQILPAYPLKYIINRNSYKTALQNAVKEEKSLKKGKKVTEENFRTVVEPNPRQVLENSLQNEINSQNRNLIMYLNKKDDLSGQFIQRLSKYDDDEIQRLNKISQKAIFSKNQDSVIHEIIRKKINGDYVNLSEKFKSQLENMKDDLNNYDKVMKNEDKKRIDKKERYFQQYRDAEKDWLKYNIVRFYKKSEPPKNSATSLLDN